MGDKDVGLWIWNNLQKGKLNVAANALSRKNDEVEALLCAISIIQLDWLAEAREEWKNKEEVWTLIQNL